VQVAGGFVHREQSLSGGLEVFGAPQLADPSAQSSPGKGKRGTGHLGTVYSELATAEEIHEDTRYRQYLDQQRQQRKHFQACHGP
jgi:hypothetical protein